MTSEMIIQLLAGLVLVGAYQVYKQATSPFMQSAGRSIQAALYAEAAGLLVAAVGIAMLLKWGVFLLLAIFVGNQVLLGVIGKWRQGFFLVSLAKHALICGYFFWNWPRFH